MSIRERLKEIRLDKGMSQQGLSEIIHVNQNTISQYESGKRSINSETLEDIANALEHNISFIKMDTKPFTIKRMTHFELIEEMNKEILKQTGVNMNFEFELCSDGNLDLYTKHIFSLNDIKRLIKLDWFDDSILEDYDFKYNTNPFELDEELNLSNNLFCFILEKTFKDGTFVSGVYDLEEYIEVNVSIPV